jgi:hypothetical protein
VRRDFLDHIIGRREQGSDIFNAGIGALVYHLDRSGQEDTKAGPVDNFEKSYPKK